MRGYVHRKDASSSTGLVFAIYNIGSIPATVFSGPLNDYFGRRWGMWVGGALIILGTCVQAPSVNMSMFLAGRFILGFGVSFSSVSGPVSFEALAPRGKKKALISVR